MFGGVDFVFADNPHLLLAAVAALDGYGGGEKNLVGSLAVFGIDHFGRFQPLGEKTDAAVDFAHPPLAVEIVAVFAAIAVGSCPVHHLHDFGALFVHQLEQFVFQSLPAGWRHIVFVCGHLAFSCLQSAFRLPENGCGVL